MLIPVYCKKCGKEFYPTPDHVYKDYTGTYCCWTCYLDHIKQREARYKKVHVIRDGHILDTYPSARYAAQVVRGDAEEIRKACREGTFYRGYFWRYADDNKEKGEN